MKRIILIISFFLCCMTTVIAQGYKDVTLVVSGEAQTKDAAISQALRSAIEMSYGTFVSANTTILNDEVVRDEVATISSGNIKSFRELGCVSTPDGYNVTLSATVSLSNLISYAKGKGASCEFAGQTFAMNLKMKELNRQNEIVAIENLKEQMSILAEDVFDINVEVKDPTIDGASGYKIPLEISLSLNGAANSFYSILTKTLSAISIRCIEYDDYKKAEVPTYKMEIKTPIVEGTHVYEYVFRNSSTCDIVKEILHMPLNNMYYIVQRSEGTEKISIPGNAFRNSYKNFPLLLLKEKAPDVEEAETAEINNYKAKIKALKKEKKKDEAKAMENELSQYQQQLASVQSCWNVHADDLDANPDDELTTERNRMYGHLQKYHMSGDSKTYYNTYYWNTNDSGSPYSFIYFNHYITKEEATKEITDYFQKTSINPIESIEIDYRTSDINTLTGFSVTKSTKE